MTFGDTMMKFVMGTQDTLFSTSIVYTSWYSHIIEFLKGPLLAAAVAAVVSWWISHRTLRASELTRLNTQIDRLVELGMEYPLMEDDQFCKSWTSEDRSENAMRYENYCCFVYNLLEGIWRFHHGSEKKIQSMFDAQELIKRHQTWWRSSEDNRSSYPQGFQHYVNEVANRKGS